MSAIQTPLEQAIDEVWTMLGHRESLFPSLALDAVLARARADEWKAATPRLLELLTSADTAEPWVIIDELEGAGWTDWGRHEVDAIENVLDVWWQTTLMFHPSDPPIETVIGTLAHTSLPLVRWLQPWLDDLDGTPVQQLAELLLGRLMGPVWVDHLDERGQIIGWAKSEPVVFGLTLVGGPHLAEGQMAELLDLLL